VWFFYGNWSRKSTEPLQQGTPFRFQLTPIVLFNL
jgi:hypothetical protein